MCVLASAFCGVKNKVTPTAKMALAAVVAIRCEKTLHRDFWPAFSARSIPAAIITFIVSCSDSSSAIATAKHVSSSITRFPFR